MINKINEIEHKFPKLSEFVRFLITAAVVCMIDVAVMAVFMYYFQRSTFESFSDVFLKTSIAPVSMTVICSGIGFLVGLIFDAVLSLWIVFDGQAKKIKSTKNIFILVLISIVELLLHTFGLCICLGLKINAFVSKFILTIVLIIIDFLIRKFIIFKKENEESQVTICQTQQKYLVSVKNIILNLLFAFSSFFFSICVYSDISLFHNFNRILKLFFALFVMLLILFYVFVVNTQLVSKCFKEIRCNKVAFALSLISTLCFEYILFVEMPWISIVRIILSFLSMLCFYVFFTLSFRFIISKIKRLFESMNRSEKIFSIVALAFSLILFLITDLVTGMFMGIPKEGIHYEIFSYDTGYIYDWNTFTNPFSFNNNIRHILLSYSFLPFTIIPYALMHILKIHFLFGIVIQIYNSLMLIVITILIKRLLKIESIFAEIAFYILTFISASFLINLLCYEKFVIPVFFAVLAVYMTINKDKTKYLYFFLAFISLSTMILLFPVIFFEKGKSFKNSIKELVVFAIFVIFAIMLCGQFSHIFSAGDEISGLMNGYGGKDYGINILHFFTLITQFWIIPEAVKTQKHILTVSPSFDSLFFICGIIIFAACIIGLALKRKDKFAQICFYWILCVIFFVIGLGWGVKANEVFLSSLTYIWAFIPALFMFFDKMIKNKKLLLGIICLFMLAVLIKNIFAYIELLQFSHSLYPTFN